MSDAYIDLQNQNEASQATNTNPEYVPRGASRAITPIAPFSLLVIYLPPHIRYLSSTIAAAPGQYQMSNAPE